MSDSKMTNGYAIYIPAQSSRVEDSVVQALGANELSDSDAESKIRAKLQEFATELQTLKANQAVL